MRTYIVDVPYWWQKSSNNRIYNFKDHSKILKIKDP